MRAPTLALLAAGLLLVTLVPSPLAAPGPACLTLPGQGACVLPQQADLLPLGDPTLYAPDWPMYGHDLWGSHYNPSEVILNNLTVGGLTHLWHFGIPGGVAGATVMAKGVVYTESWSGHIYALNAATGAKVWDANLRQTMSASPAVANGIVYVTTLYPGNLVALTAATGRVLWQVPLDAVAEGWGSPVVVGDIVLVGQSGGDTGLSQPHAGSLQAFDGLTGTLLWRTYTSPQNIAGAPVWTTPAVLGGIAFVGTGNDFGWGNDVHSTAIQAINITTGDRLWMHHFADFGDEDFGASPQLFVSGGKVVLGEAQKLHYHALDPLTGDLYWTKVTGGDWTIGTPAVAYGTIYGSFGFGGGWWTSPNYATALSERTGAQQWVGGLAGSLSATAVAGNVAYFAEQNGNLRAYDAASGAVLWSGHVNGGTYSGPVIAGGRMFEGSGSGVDAFGLV